MPEHHCRIPDNVSITDALPMDDLGKPEKCEVYSNLSYATNKTEACPDGWTYDPEIGTTIVTEVGIV